MARRTFPTPSNPNPNSDADLLEVAKSRLREVLSRRVVATTRTLEREICETSEQSLEPRILGMARKTLVRDGELEEKTPRTSQPRWYFLPDAPPDEVQARLATLVPRLQEVSRSDVMRRRGQCLELAIYRALCATPDAHYFFGQFRDFDPSDPKRTKNLYRKEEPPRHIGNRAIPGDGRLDFLYMHPAAGPAGVEAKNGRRWHYPNGDVIRELLIKCIALDCVPILVARRLPRVASEVLGTCGVVLHQTRNQLYHAADKDIAYRAKAQDSLGYDDIRVGDEPDAGLLRFIGVTLPKVLPDARTRFNKFKDLLARYTDRKIQFDEFAGRVQCRAAGRDEDHWADDDQNQPDHYYY